ncbi:hypothetical protein PoB_001713800 [Plakobranchus ocellatus]|uniref:Uncharacterized protein n=1 Tax=Plakobranchus ocellatus TaxID=259542 RepID=A0AAV3Z7E3_9GAST|nr:hypothetical protein PoB_001713800 [Plakobranchus ocellatus]
MTECSQTLEDAVHSSLLLTDDPLNRAGLQNKEWTSEVCLCPSRHFRPERSHPEQLQDKWSGEGRPCS